MSAGRLQRAVLLLWPLLWSAAAQAGTPVTIETQFDQDIAGLDQTLQLTVNVTVHGGLNIDQIELPKSPVLQVIGSSRSEQSRFSMGPGGVDSSHTTLYRLSLRPLKVGDFTLSPAQVVVGGRVYKGSSPHLKIVPAGQGPAPQAPPRQSNNPFAGFGFPGFGQPPGFGQNPGFTAPPQGDLDDDDPFAQLFGGGRPPSGEDVVLVGSVDHKKAVLGQQITYAIRLYTRADVSELSDLKLPGFDGFWGEDLETPLHPVPKLQTLGGVPYQVLLLKKKALFPDRAGTLTIPPAEIDLAIGIGFFRGRKVHRESAPLAIEVSPLPANAPAGFSATNVGQWRFAATLSPASVPVGEPATLTLSVEGVGNLHGLSLPTVPAIPGVRAYDPSSTDKIATQGERFGGRRQVDITLIPQRTGDFEIPPLTFQWFDPQTGYQVTTTPKLSLRAAVGSTGGGAAGATPAGQNLLESTFRPLRDSPALLASCQPARFGSPRPLEGWPLGLALGFPPLVLLGGLFGQSLRTRRAKAAPSLRGRRAYRVARQRLAAKASPTSAAIAQGLFGYLEDRLGESMAGLAFPELRARLLAQGAEEGTVRATLAALELAESLRYMPTGSAQAREIDKLRSMAEFALESLERASLKKAKPSGRAA